VFLGISKLKPLISSIINFYCQSILASWPLSLCLILVQILYLTNHYHITHVADSHSPLGFPTSGAHQGSILKLSPTLFSAFIKIFLWCFLLTPPSFLPMTLLSLSLVIKYQLSNLIQFNFVWNWLICGLKGMAWSWTPQVQEYAAWSTPARSCLVVFLRVLMESTVF
jgi:hypothetical protein